MFSGISIVPDCQEQDSSGACKSILSSPTAVSDNLSSQSFPPQTNSEVSRSNDPQGSDTLASSYNMNVLLGLISNEYPEFEVDDSQSHEIEGGSMEEGKGEEPVISSV
jgi:hypothetical protein